MPSKHEFISSLAAHTAEDITANAAKYMQSVIEDEQPPGNAIIAHNEGVDLLPSNIELSGMETGLFNVMSREYVLKSCIEGMKKNYDYILIDCIKRFAESKEHRGMYWRKPIPGFPVMGSLFRHNIFSDN